METRITKSVYNMLKPMCNRRYTVGFTNIMSMRVGDDRNRFRFAVAPFKSGLYVYDGDDLTSIVMITHIPKTLAVVGPLSAYFAVTDTDIYRIETYPKHTRLCSVTTHQRMNITCSSKVIGYRDRLYYADGVNLNTIHKFTQCKIGTAHESIIHIDCVNAYICATSKLEFTLYKRHYPIKTWYVYMFAEQAYRISGFRRVFMVRPHIFYIEDHDRNFYELINNTITPIKDCLTVLRYRNFMVFFIREQIDGNYSVKFVFKSAHLCFCVSFGVLDFNPDTVFTDHHTICWISKEHRVCYLVFPTILI